MNDQDNTNPTPQHDGQHNDDPLTILLQGQIAALESQLKTAQAETEEWKEKALRAQADFQNARTRHEKEKTDLIRYGSERLLKDLLPCLDTFTQAFTHLPEDLGQHPWVQGIIQSEKMLMSVLKQGGLEKIEIIPGETTFDPNHHEAIAQENGDNKDTIAEVFQDGYLLSGKVIRPSKVKVTI